MNNITNKFRVAIMAVPEREQIMKVITDELDKHNVPYDIFMDYDHNGVKWNFNRILETYCNGNYDEHIIISNDDLIFKDGYFDKANEVMDKTDYKVLSMFTNQNSKPNDICNIRKATSPYFYYEVGAIFRKGTLNPEFLKEFREWENSPERCIKETNHPDNMISTFLFNHSDKYKCGTVRPNYIALQDVPSTLGHKIVRKDN